jgi:natural product precursor
VKKNTTKLTLSKETLRSLDEKQVNDVVGGIDKSLQYSRCINNSCGIACTYQC